MSQLCANHGTTPSARICELMRKRASKLVIISPVAGEALSLMKRPDANSQNVSRLLERDLSLATDILRLANSPAFGGCRDVSRLSDAVVRLGLNRCQDLILSTCTANMLRRVTLEQHWIRDVLWRHSYATGVCCQILNAAFGLGFTGEEFTAGLIHDLGRLLLAVVVPEHFHEGDPMDFDESGDLLERERSVFETDHAELGAWFAEESGLPYSLVDVIRHHHVPERATQNKNLVALVAVADRMSNHFLRYESPEGFDLTDARHMIPQLRNDATPSIESNDRASVMLAWNRVQTSTDLIA